jgi:hypothetical protein
VKLGQLGGTQKGRPVLRQEFTNSMTNKFAKIVFLIGTTLCQSSCRRGTREDCAKHIKDEIHTGMSVETAKEDLEKCGFKVTTDPAKKALYGDKLVEGIPISERTQVLIQVDSDNRVASVNVTTGLIGP